MKLRFYHCNICGKTIALLSDSEVPTICCGQAMTELIPNHTDGAIEKHVPVFHITDNTVSVQVGSAAHPMTDDHSILWIGLSTTQGFRFHELHPGDVPTATFLLAPDETVSEVLALCNLHGLWAVNADA